MNKSKFNYNEDIIDGFSILCFGNYMSLNKFSQSINEVIRSKVTKDISKSTSTSTKVKQLNDFKKNFKTKLEPKIVLTPTRVTAQRKSKPDISTLSLSMCKRRQPTYTAMSPKDIESPAIKQSFNCSFFIDDISDIPKKDLSVHLPLKMRCKNVMDKIRENDTAHSDTTDDGSGLNKEIPDEVSHKCFHEQHDICSNHFQKDDSIMEENSITANSTLSPVSIQQMHGMLCENEYLDLNSPEKLDLNHDEIEKVDLKNKNVVKIILVKEDFGEICLQNDFDDKIDLVNQDNYKINLSDENTCKLEEIQEDYCKSVTGHENLNSTDDYLKNILGNAQNRENHDIIYTEQNNDDKVSLKDEDDIDQDYQDNNEDNVYERHDIQIDLTDTNVSENVSTTEIISNRNLSFNESINKKEIIFDIIKDEEEDDCVILSVGFDPDPRLINIPVASYLLEVPNLKPSPSVTFNVHTKSLPFSSVTFPSELVNAMPPPLIPAPTQYLGFLDQYQNTNNNSIHSDLGVCQKLKIRKRRQMKSSILKTPTKCKKISLGNVPIRANVKFQFTLTNGENLTQSSFENTSLSKEELYSLQSHTIRQEVPSPSGVTYPMHLYPKPILPNATKYEMNLVKPIATKNWNVIQSTKSRIGPSQCFIRKTICHVHIAQLIQRKLILDHAVDSFSVNIKGLLKPRALRPIIESFNPFQMLSPFNVSSSLRSMSPYHQLPYHTKSLQSLNVSNISDEFAVLIKPIHKSLHIPNHFNSRFSNPLNMYPRQNVLLLK